MILLLLSGGAHRVSTWLHQPLGAIAAALEPITPPRGTATWLHQPLLAVAAVGDPTPPEPVGGAARFGPGRPMLVVDETAWEEEGIVVPLMLDEFP